MSRPIDTLFWLAVAVLCLGAFRELVWTARRLAPIARAVLGVFLALPIVAPARPRARLRASVVPLPVAVPPASPAATNYLESMSAEEMDQFLAPPDE